MAELSGDDGRPQRPVRPSSRSSSNPLGLALRELPPSGRDALGVDYGLIVEATSAAAAATGIEPGDVIVAVTDKTFSSREEFSRLLARAKGDEPIALLVRRDEGSLYVALKKAEAPAKTRPG